MFQNRFFLRARPKTEKMPKMKRFCTFKQGIHGSILGLETLILGCFGLAEGFQHLEEVTIFLWAKKKIGPIWPNFGR